MSISNKIELNAYNQAKQQWESVAHTNYAAAVIASDGKNLQQKLNEIPTQISTAQSNTKQETLTEIRGGVVVAGNTLAKLHSLITGIQTVINSDTASLDTMQEIVNYIKANRGDLNLIGTNKIDKTSITQDLTLGSTVEGKVLDGRVGKVLKDLINLVAADVSALQTQAGSYITEQQATTIANTVAAQSRPIMSATPPANPTNGMLWHKIVGTIEI